MSDIDDDKFVTAWWSKQSLRELAEELGVAQYVLEREWRRLKYVGRLPQAKRDMAGRASAWERDGDQPPLWARDRLLERLREEHGDPRYDFYFAMRKSSAN